MNIMTIILLIIFAFMFIPLILAEIARSKARRTLEDFFLHGRTMPLIMVFFTVYATWVSSFAFLGSTTSFYYNGPLYMTCFAWDVLFALLFMLIGNRIWFYGKINGYMTATDFFADIYRSRLLSCTVTFVVMIFTIPYLIIQLFSGALLIETVSRGIIPWPTAGILFYFIIIIYLWAGGLRAVAMTDIYYGILIFISMILSGFLLLHKAGGLEKMFYGIQKQGETFFTLGDLNDENSPLIWLSMFIIVPIGALMGPPMWIRIYSAANEKIFKVLPLMLTAATIMYIGPLLAGTAAKYLYPDIEFSDNMLVLIIIKNAPMIFAALLICGIASASLSTANSQIHALAAVYTIDVHKRYINKNISERNLLKVGKYTVLVVSIIAYLLMLNFPMNIIDLGMLSFSGTAQLFVPTAGALIWEKSKAISAIICIWISIPLSLALWLFFDISIMYSTLSAFIVNIFVFITVSLVLPDDMETRNRIIKYKNEFLKRRR